MTNTVSGTDNSTPAERAMRDIEAHLERWFNGEQTQAQAMAAICIISGVYKGESGNA